MATTLTSIDTLMTAAIAAMEDGDFSTAMRKALAAQAYLSLFPDTVRAEGGGATSGASQSMRFDRLSIADFIKNLRKFANQSIGIQVENVSLEALGDLGDIPSGGTIIGDV